MSRGALVDWKSECEAIHKEMDDLFRAGRLETAEARQIRRLQFLALIERRNAAARKLLEWGSPNKPFGRGGK